MFTTIHFHRWVIINLGVNMPTRVERSERKNNIEIQLVGELTTEYYDVVMFFGIIEILQEYDMDTEKSI
jgi:1-phosphatidylinositol-4-phosphate 5-kinase